MKPLVRAPGIYNYPRFSPDGESLAFRAGNDIAVYDIRRETMTPVTFTGQAIVPVWAPDGKHIAFRSNSAEGYGLSWIRADGGGDIQALLTSSTNVIPYSLSPDGRQLAYHQLDPDTGYDIWTLPLDLRNPDHPKPGKPSLFLRTPANETVPVFSPNGHWIAYKSDESGTNEIYVRPYPTSGGKWRISNGGAAYAIWSPNGRELFYETLDGYIMVLDYSTEGSSFIPGNPHLWSTKQIFYPGTSNLGLHPDGKRFAVFPMPEAGSKSGSVHVTFLLNFFDELRRRVTPPK